MKVLFIILGIIAIGIAVGYNVYGYNNIDYFKIKKIPLIGGIALGLALFVLAASIVIIPTGYTGVKSTFGQVDEKIIPTGFSFKVPFITKVTKINNKQVDYELSSDTEIGGETKVRTAISFGGITVNYTINPEYSAWIVANVSDYKDSLITPSVISSALKTASKTLSDEEATNRGTIERLAKEEIQKSLNDKFQNEVVFVNKVTIESADFEKSYNQAIASKQAAQLAYEKQQIENKKALEKAETDAKIKKTEAQGKAEAAIIAAEGEKKANDILNQSLNDKIIKNKAVDKWNGKLPQVMGKNDVLMDLTDSNK